MKKSILRPAFLLATAFAFLVTATYAQTPRIVNVAPGIGTLNDAIDGDTTMTGDRIDPNNTIYQLDGGGVYELTRTVENDGFPLHIRVNPADSDRALLSLFDSGAGASRAFEARGNLKIEGLKVTNADQNGEVNERIMRLREADITVIVENCWLEIDAQTAFRCDEDIEALVINNSIISSIGFGFDPDNGRMIDDRGNDIDSLVIFNSAIYNITSRFLRDGGGTIDYAKVDQNTFVNSAQRGFEFGIAREVYFTNNLIVNGSFEGIDEPEFPGEESESFVDVDVWIPNPAAQILVVSHNNTFTQSALTDLYPAGIQAVPLLNADVEALVSSPGLLSTNISEVLTFNNGPAPPTQYLTDFFNGNIANSPQWWDPDFLTYDFGYSTSSASFTGGSEGQNIGLLFDPGCTANGGTLSFSGNKNFCVGTGSPSSIDVTVTGASGTFERWGLFDSNGNLVANRGANSQFNLDIYSPGTYTIRYIRYEADTDISQITSLASVASLEGCFGTSSNAIQVVLQEQPQPGTLSAASSTTICTASGPSSRIDLNLSGFNAPNRIYAIVSQSLGNQVVKSKVGTPTGTSFNLGDLPAGIYRAAVVAYQPGVSLAGVQFQSDLEGCFEVSNTVLINLVDCPALALSASPNPTAGPSFVSFSNSREEFATLEVYDMSGRMVQNIFSQVTNPGQEYRFEFDGSGLPNGVYLYRLTTDSEVAIEKFMIAR